MNNEDTFVLTPWGCLWATLEEYGIDTSEMTAKVGESMVNDFMDAMVTAGYIAEEKRNDEMFDGNVNEEAVQEAYRRGCETTSGRYEEMVKRLTDDVCNLRCHVNVLEKDLEEMTRKYEDEYEENMRIKDNMRRWIADMKGKVND